MLESAIRILIIDDCPEDRELYRSYLRKMMQASYEFAECETAEDGLDLFTSFNPDCILLDYRIPGMDGLDFLAHLGAHGPAVVMMTSQGSESVAVEAMKRGAQDYLIKNEITPDTLARTIQNAITKAALLEQIEIQRLALERSNRDLQDFAHAISHDLKAPLHTIRTWVEVLERKYGSAKDEQFRSMLHNLHCGLRQMNQLINDTLDYSRLGFEQRRFTVLSLRNPLDEAIGNLAGLVNETGAQIEVRDLPEIEADHGQMRQLFQNLIHNALKFQRPGVASHILVASYPISCNTQSTDSRERPFQFYQVIVKDNGIGFDSDDPNFIFGLFNKLGEGERLSEGTGVGLALCRKIVERHNGQIRAESKTGGGATFIITLPLRQPRLRGYSATI